MSAENAGIELEFTGEGLDEIGTVRSVDADIAPRVKVGNVILKIDPHYFHPAKVETLLGDPFLAKEKLG